MAQQYTLIKTLPGQYNRKLFYSSSADPADFPIIKNKVDIAPGSKLQVIQTGEEYILSADYVWTLYPGAGGTLNPADLISAEGGNTLVLGSDGRLYNPSSAVSISTDPGNLIVYGSDGNLYGGLFNKNKVYHDGEIVIYESKLYRSISETIAGNPFNPDDWKDLSQTIVTNPDETQTAIYTVTVDEFLQLIQDDALEEGSAYDVLDADEPFII